MIPKKRLSGEVVLKLTLGMMERHLSVKTEGYRSTTRQTQHVLLKAVASGHSVEAVCQDRQYPVSGNTLREQLNTALPVAKLREQEEEMNAALQASLPSAMPRGGLEVAMDTHDEPCYGAKAHWQPYTIKGRARAGTTRFLRLASAYVIWRSVRLTLAVRYVLPGESLPQVVEVLLTRLQQLGLHATVLYLDKGFCSGEVIRTLQRQQQAAVLACPIRGKSGGIRALCHGRGSFTTDYTFTDGTPARLALVDTRVPDPKTRRKHRKWLAFVCVNLDWTPQQVFDKYRRRFGIEASYRILRQVRTRTNSRNPALRFFLFGLALLLQNVWVLLRWLCCHRPGRGRHKLLPKLLRFHRYCALLIRAIDRLFPPAPDVPVFALPDPSLLS